MHVCIHSLVCLLQWLRARFYEKEDLLSSLQLLVRVGDRTVTGWPPVRFSSDQVPASRRLLHVGCMAAGAAVVWSLLWMPTSRSLIGYALLLWRSLVLIGTITCCVVTYSQSGEGLDGLALTAADKQMTKASGS